MNINIGAKIREIAKEKGVGPTELGKRINTSKQNVYGIFKRKSMDSNLISEISIALDHNFFQYYMEDLQAHWGHRMATVGSNGAGNTAEVSRLNGEIAHLKTNLELSQELNTMLKEKLKVCEGQRVKQ